ncbi:MAG: hypothetical protein ACE5R6_16625 [Candidatus Heimdallarchaeota archaeon]
MKVYEMQTAVDLASQKRRPSSVIQLALCRMHLGRRSTSIPFFEIA